MKTRKPYCAYVGSVCRAARLRSGESLRAMADGTGYSVAYLSDFENGYADSMRLVAAYASILTDAEIIEIVRRKPWQA